MRLTESDLRFVVETLAAKRRDHDHIIGLLRDRDDMLEPMLDDPRLAERLINDLELFVRISPYLMFSILLRRVRRDLENQSFVLERDERGRQIPVFEAAQVGQLLSDPSLREYLAEMLCSFIRTNIAVLYRQEDRAAFFHPANVLNSKRVPRQKGSSWQKCKFSDMDMNDMMALCQLVEAKLKPRLYKRIADIALFLTGVHPDHASFFIRKPRSQHWRVVPDYEREGRRFYSLAARESEAPGPVSVFEKLADQFTQAREALNMLSGRYLKPIPAQYFDQSDH